MYTYELNKLYFSEENMSNIDELSINAIRFLSADAIQKANSGHPGLHSVVQPLDMNYLQTT